MSAIETTSTLHEEWTPIIDDTASVPGRHLDHQFDPDKHLAYAEPRKIYTMTELGFPADQGISSIAASEPFQLFTPDAVKHFRDEIFSKDVMENCKFSGDLGACMLRGYASKYAPFINNAWHSPAILKIVSDIAGIDLVPNMDYEIGHVNISVKSEDQAASERASNAAQAASGKDWANSASIVGWHNDSYPFVCVVMLSDCTKMIGGETALRKADGGIIKVRGPQMGCAVVMQGRYITHQALRALGAQERITMVTSFRPKSPFVADDSVLNTIRGVSNLSELYFGFAEYRLDILEQRIRSTLRGLHRNHSAGKKTATREIKQFLDESIQFLTRTNSEIVQDEDVVAGHQPTLNIPDVKSEPDACSAGPLLAKL